MVKKKVKKDKLTENEKEEVKLEGEIPKEKVRNREDRQLLWFFIIIGIVFASFLIPYFWAEGEKTFEYVGADWVVEEYPEPTGDIYHGRFKALSGADLMFNVFFRGDPRENDVRTEGTFNKFKRGGIVSFSPEVDECRGELGRVMLDLGSFLREGVGVGSIETGYIDSVLAIENEKRYATCDRVNDRSLVIVKIGEPAVVQNESYSYCYTIYAKDCDDVSSVEKFMIKTIEDFGAVEE